MIVPDTFEEGFNFRTVVGAFFIGFVMMPGAIYLGLLMGARLGPAAEWVTIILFTEAARRSFVTLGRQEIYMLYYIAGTLTATIGGLFIAGGPFGQFIWNVYFAGSPAAASFADQIPTWVVPKVGSEAFFKRSFVQSAWVAPIIVMLISNVLWRLNWFTASYVLFRATSDVERLPFPLAPIAAQGATALAESSSKQETWRWRIFSIGAMIGLSFGAIYVGVPTLTGVTLAKPIEILPIPWIDFTTGTESILPATAIAIGTDIGIILWGFVLPLWIVLGTTAAFILTLFINPTLYHFGILHQWQPGMGLVDVKTANWLDFWLSFSIGSGLIVGLIGMGSTFKTLMRQRRARREGLISAAPYTPPEGRGDFNVPLCVGLFIISTLGYIGLSHYLVGRHSEVSGRLLFIFFFFGFVWTPLISYIDARMVGIAGHFIGFPMVREVAFILSQHKNVDIWFAPIPMHVFAAQVQKFREVELIGASFRGLLKCELLAFPVLLTASFVFWEFIWKLAPIPSAQFPYAQKMWPWFARQRALFMTATTENPELFLSAIDWRYITTGGVFTAVLFAILARVGAPLMFVYGMIRGMGATPDIILPELFGALLGRYYFLKRYGRQNWRNYAPVLAAGYSCGMGLISMVSIAIALIAKSISQTPY